MKQIERESEREREGEILCKHQYIETNMLVIPSTVSEASLVSNTLQIYPAWTFKSTLSIISNSQHKIIRLLSICLLNGQPSYPDYTLFFCLRHCHIT